MARAKNPELTREVLGELLGGDITHLLNLSELQLAVDALGDEALEIYATRARDPGTTDEEGDALAVLVGHLDGSRISERARLAVALDGNLPVAVRLAAFASGPSPIDERALPLIDAAIASDAYAPRSAAMRAVAKTTDPFGALRSVLLRADIPTEQRKKILGYLKDVLPEAVGQRSRFVRDLARDPALPENLRWHLLVCAARYGDTPAMERILSRFADLPFEIVGAAVCFFGHHRSRRLVERAIEQLRIRVPNAQERVALAVNAVTGMTSLLEMDGFFGGVIKPAQPHPGIDLAAQLIEEWSAMKDYTPVESLRIDEQLTRLGSDAALPRLPGRIEQVLRSDDLDLQDLNLASFVGNAIQALEERHQRLPLGLLKRVVARCSYNGASAAVRMMAGHGSREVLDRLLAIHVSARDTHLKGAVFDAIEALSGRLGLRVRTENGQLETAAS